VVTHACHATCTVAPMRHHAFLKGGIPKANNSHRVQAMREWDLQPASKQHALPADPSGTADKMSAVPKRVVQLSDILCVAAGANHTVVASARGVYTFGCNDHGQLGLGNSVDSHVPVRVKALSQARDNITQVAAGQCHTLFISESNRVFATGSCELGQFQTATSGMSNVFGGVSGEKRPLHAVPTRIQLPFLEGHGAAAKAVLHEAKAGGNASVYLIRAPDDPVRRPRCIEAICMNLLVSTSPEQTFGRQRASCSSFLYLLSGWSAQPTDTVRGPVMLRGADC
jgi:hypothetical protein